MLLTTMLLQAFLPALKELKSVKVQEARGLKLAPEAPQAPNKAASSKAKELVK